MTATLVTHWSPSRVPISWLKLQQATLKAMQTATKRPPPVDTDMPLEMQKTKVADKLQKPMSQLPPARLQPTWD